MIKNQKDIHANQNKFLKCYFPQQERKIIPDTMVSREIAIKGGASHFDTLSLGDARKNKIGENNYV